MTALVSIGVETKLLSTITEAATTAIENTFSSIFGEKPCRDVNSLREEGPCVAGIISFIGDITWSLTWVLPKKIAPIMASIFTGSEFPFESSEMGEIAAELVNILAGEIVAQLEKKRIHAQMSLPWVVRGNHLEFTPEIGPGVVHMDFTSSNGSFWFRLVTAKSTAGMGRRPGS